MKTSVLAVSASASGFAMAAIAKASAPTEESGMREFGPFEAHDVRDDYAVDDEIALFDDEEEE